MKINPDFKKLFLPSLVFSISSVVVGVLMLLIFSGKTYAEYTLNNLRSSLLVKGVVFVVLIFIATTLYYVLRFKKKGLWLGFFSALSASLNALVSFAFCIICRANLGELTFVVLFSSVILTYMTSLVFEDKIYMKPQKNQKNLKNKTKEPEYKDLLLSDALQNAFDKMKFVLLLIVVITAISFVIALFFGTGELLLYALPVILSSVVSVITTLSYVSKFYKV